MNNLNNYFDPVKGTSIEQPLSKPRNIFDQLFYYRQDPTSYYELGYKWGWENVPKDEAFQNSRHYVFGSVDPSSGDTFKDSIEFEAGWIDGQGDHAAVYENGTWLPLLKEYSDWENNKINVISISKQRKLTEICWKP